jgi:ribose-phosphate pyrophosphokinase
VVIYDDMIRTGGSLIGAATAYREAGASSFSIVATHGVLPGDALSRLHESGLFERIICTDTHPRARQLAGNGLTVKPIDGLIWHCLANFNA